MTAEHRPAGGGGVADHTFYLWDDTDEHTRTLCGVGCGYGPEDHISREAFAARERLRDAAPALLAALETLSHATAANPCWCLYSDRPGAHTDRCQQARDAVRAARGAEADDSEVSDGE